MEAVKKNDILLCVIKNSRPSYEVNSTACFVPPPDHMRVNRPCVVRGVERRPLKRRESERER